MLPSYQIEDNFVEDERCSDFRERIMVSQKVLDYVIIDCVFKVRSELTPIL